MPLSQEGYMLPPHQGFVPPSLLGHQAVSSDCEGMFKLCKARNKAHKKAHKDRLKVHDDQHCKVKEVQRRYLELRKMAYDLASKPSGCGKNRKKKGSDDENSESAGKRR